VVCALPGDNFGIFISSTNFQLRTLGGLCGQAKAPAPSCWLMDEVGVLELKKPVGAEHCEGYDQFVQPSRGASTGSA
jgi:hypothetical protein